MGGGCEVFKDKGFICKFVECILITGMGILFIMKFMNLHSSDVMWHLSVVCCGAVFYFFFPFFIMMVMYATNGFNDHLYELILAAVAAGFSLFAAVFLLVFHYDDSYDTSDYSQRYHQGSSKSDGSSSDGFKEGHLVAEAVISLLLMITFLVDACLNGAQLGG